MGVETLPSCSDCNTRKPSQPGKTLINYLYCQKYILTFLIMLYRSWYVKTRDRY